MVKPRGERFDLGFQLFDALQEHTTVRTRRIWLERGHPYRIDVRAETK